MALQWNLHTLALLLFGNEGHYHENDMSSTKLRPVHDKLQASISTCLSEVEGANQEVAALAQKLHDLECKVSHEEEALSDQHILDMLKQYALKQHKIHHLVLAHSMHQLKHYQHVKDIPELIFRTCQEVPAVLMGHSKIKTLVVTTVNEVKIELLAQFHALFEGQLVESQRTSAQASASSNDSDSASAKGAANLWVTFISQARDWLLAFALVNLLPVVLTETKEMVLEKYQESLDEALTPVWGRFHFHLKVIKSCMLQITQTAMFPFPA